jgi:hypothetical protein
MRCPSRIRGGRRIAAWSRCCPAIASSSRPISAGRRLAPSRRRRRRTRPSCRLPDLETTSWVHTVAGSNPRILRHTTTNIAQATRSVLQGATCLSALSSADALLIGHPIGGLGKVQVNLPSEKRSTPTLQSSLACAHLEQQRDSRALWAPSYVGIAIGVGYGSRRTKYITAICVASVLLVVAGVVAIRKQVLVVTVTSQTPANDRLAE